jgi:hypothetical protein
MGDPFQYNLREVHFYENISGPLDPLSFGVTVHNASIIKYRINGTAILKKSKLHY